MINRSIIIEGPDSSGKTTLIGQLEKIFEVISEHDGGPPQCAEDVLDKIQNNLRKLINPTLCDRSFFISEVIYASVLKSDTRYPTNVEKTREMRTILYNHHKPIIIFCRPATDTMLKMDNHEVKSHETEEHVKAVNMNQVNLISAYDLERSEILSGDLDVDIIGYDYENDSFEILVKTLKLLGV